MLHSSQVPLLLLDWSTEALTGTVGLSGSVIDFTFWILGGNVIHRHDFLADLCRVETLDVAFFPPLLFFHSGQSKSVALSPLRLYAHACRAHKAVNTPYD